jgi:hypothetical protein
MTLPTVVLRGPVESALRQVLERRGQAALTIDHYVGLLCAANLGPSRRIREPKGFRTEARDRPIVSQSRPRRDRPERLQPS